MVKHIQNKKRTNMMNVLKYTNPIKHDFYRTLNETHGDQNLDLDNPIENVFFMMNKH